MSDVQIMVIGAGILLNILFLLFKSQQQNQVRQAQLHKTALKPINKRIYSLSSLEEPLEINDLVQGSPQKKVKVNFDQIPTTPTFLSQKNNFHFNKSDAKKPSVPKQSHFKPYFEEQQINHSGQKKEKVQSKAKLLVNRTNQYDAELLDQKFRLITSAHELCNPSTLSFEIQTPEDQQFESIRQNYLDISFSNPAMNQSPLSPKKKPIIEAVPQFVKDERNPHQQSMTNQLLQDMVPLILSSQDQLMHNKISQDNKLPSIEQNISPDNGMKKMKRNSSQQYIHPALVGPAQSDDFYNSRVVEPQSNNDTILPSIPKQGLFSIQQNQMLHLVDNINNQTQPTDMFRNTNTQNGGLFSNLIPHEKKEIALQQQIPQSEVQQQSSQEATVIPVSTPMGLFSNLSQPQTSQSNNIFSGLFNSTPQNQQNSIVNLNQSSLFGNIASSNPDKPGGLFGRIM